MKRHIIAAIGILLSSCMLPSCLDGCKTIYIRSYHLIDCYNEWSSFKLYIEKEFIVIQFKLEEKYYSAECQELFNPQQTTDQLDMFYKLAAQNEDIGYDWGCYYLHIGDHISNQGIYPGITGILITSDHDFDDSHPAGTSLNDIFNAHYFSYTQFLGDVDHSDVAPGDPTLGRTEKRCSEIDNGELSVIHPYHFYLYPAHAPTVWKDRHLLTVTLTDENGVEHSASVEMDFTEP